MTSVIWILDPFDTSLAGTAPRCRRAYMLPPRLSFFFVFSTPNLWTDLNQTWTHSFMTATWKIWSEHRRAFTPTGWEAKTAFWGPNLNSDRTYLCNGTWSQQPERNLSIYRDSPTYPQIWWTLVQKRPRTVGEFLPTPKFSHWETLPALPHGRYITDNRQTLARVM